MRGRVDQRALVVLAVNFHKLGSDFAQDLYGHRAVVDEGAGAAVRELHAAQDHVAFVLDRKIVCAQEFPRRMLLRKIEGRRDLPLLCAVANERGIAACAERQCKRVEHDGFTGTGLAGEYGKPPREIDIQPVDQNDIADRKVSEHERIAAPGIPIRPIENET